MAFPTLAAWWSPTTNPFATPTWTQMLDSAGNNALRGYQVKRGKQKWLDRVQAATATLVLRNRDGIFTPWNTGGANYPNVAPIKRVQIRATYGGTTYNRFTGFLNTLQPTWVNNEGESSFQAYDLFGLLALAYSSAPYPATVLADGPIAYYRFQEPTLDGALAIDSSGNAANGSYSLAGLSGGGTAPVQDTTAKVATFDGVAGSMTTAPFAFGTSDLSIEFWYQFSTTNAQVLVVFATPSVAPGNRLNIVETGRAGTGLPDLLFGSAFGWNGTNIQDGNWHHVVATRQGTTIQCYVDGAAGHAGSATPANLGTCPVTLGGDPPALWTPGNYAELAVYNYALTPTQVAKHFTAAAGWLGMASGTRITTVAALAGVLAGDLNIDAGQSTLATADDLAGTPVLEHFLGVGETENGLLFVNAAGQLRFIARQSLQVNPLNVSQGTFGDASNGSEIPYDQRGLTISLDDIDIVNSYDVTRKNGGTFSVVASAATIAPYGPARKQKISILAATDAESQYAGQWDLLQSQAPLPRIEGMVMTGHDANFAAILARELGDLVTVNARLPGSTLLSQSARVLGMSETADASKRTFQATWQLWPRETQAMLLNDATWGTLNGPGVLGY